MSKHYFVHDSTWETEAQLIARLKKLPPRPRTLAQLAVKAGLAKTDRNPRAFGELLETHDIAWIPETDFTAVPYDFWQLDGAYLAREAVAEHRAAIAAAKTQIRNGKVRIYRGGWV